MHRMARMTKPKNSRQWVEYFKANRQKLLFIPWEDDYKLSQSERASISESLRIFQLGESSAGRRLRKLTAHHAEKICDSALPQAMNLFIQEEQRHAHDLGRFLCMQSIAQKKFHWTDLFFRALRRLWNFEVCLSVLFTAELIAKSYYRSLRKATASAVLQRLCTQLLRDEVQHLHFHCRNLAILRSHRSTISIAIREKCYAFFHSSTLLTVWIGHRKVFHAAGMNFRQYWKQAQQNKHRALQDVRRLTRRKKRSSGINFYRMRLQFQTNDAMQFLDITDRVTSALRKTKIRNGIVNIQTHHTTTGLMINENEPLLLQDIQRILNRIAPEDESYRHNDFSIRTVNMQPFEDKNGHAHCRALFLRTSESIHIIDGALSMGRWQRLFFIECDRPRLRTVNILIFGLQS